MSSVFKTGVIALGLLITACLDQIDLKNQTFDTKAIIIQGRLVRGLSSSIIEVNIQRIGDYTGIETSNYVVGAKVKLINETIKQTIDVPEDRPELIYQTSIAPNGPMRVRDEDLYSIDVELPDGRIFKSSAEKLLPVPPIKSLTNTETILSLPDKKGIIQTDAYMIFNLNTDSKINGLSARIRWEVTGVYKFTDDRNKVCYAYENIKPEKVLLYDGASLNSSDINSLVIAETRRDYRFSEGYYMTIVQESLSESAYTYWNQIKILAERGGNMFEAPPATIRSNMRNVKNEEDKAFGYFYATTQDTMRMYIPPLPLKRYCPQPPTDRIGPTICDNCSLLLGSTIKPHYWK